MKARIFARLSLAVFLLWSGLASAQFDDLYYDHKKDKSFVAKKQTVNETTYTEDDSYAGEGDFYEDDNFDDYDYGTRIRRFHRPVVQNIYYSNFDSWWYNDFYDPFWNNDPFWPNNRWNSWGNNGINVFIGSPFMSFNRWNRWNSPWGFNSWSSWNDPWQFNSMGWNSWNRPWGWNSWNNCPPYATVWNNNGGWNNNVGWNNWNSGNGSGIESNSRTYGSRKGGSLSSSVGGRDASPRRENVSGGNVRQETNVKSVDQNVETRSSNRSSGRASDNTATSRTFKGDINDNGSRDNSTSRRGGSIYNDGRRSESVRNEGSSSSSRRSADSGSSRGNDANTSRSNEYRSSSRIYDSGSSPSRSSGNNSGSTRNNSWDSGSSSRSSSWDSGSSSRSSSPSSSSSGSSSSGSSSGSSGGSSRGSQRGGG